MTVLPAAKPRILVIEDNSDMREFLRRVLERHGYGFSGSERTESEGLEIALREQPELILMDLVSAKRGWL